MVNSFDEVTACPPVLLTREDGRMFSKRESQFQRGKKCPLRRNHDTEKAVTGGLRTNTNSYSSEVLKFINGFHAVEEFDIYKHLTTKIIRVLFWSLHPGKDHASFYKKGISSPNRPENCTSFQQERPRQAAGSSDSQDIFLEIAEVESIRYLLEILNTQEEHSTYVPDIVEEERQRGEEEREEEREEEEEKAKDVIKDRKSMEEYQEILMTVEVCDEFKQSPAMKALVTDASESRGLCDAESSKVEVDLAVRLFIVQHHRYPNAKELLSVLIDLDYNTNNIMSKFVNMYNAMSEEEKGRQFHPQTVPSSDGEDGSPDVTAEVPDVEETVDEPDHLNSEMAGNSNDVSDPTSIVGVVDGESNEEIEGNTNDKSEEATEDSVNDKSADEVPEEMTTRPRHPRPVLSRRAVLERESKYLKKATRCLLCDSKPPEVTFLPCSHFRTCSTCSTTVDYCPVCQKRIRAQVQTYLA
ncbi:uncharacterized protein LOC101859963 [Aplysia californica]|uniref:Uncharacterized protein LOC101859963 n=1 Tax=Aplysia californica TaxID=6500 RepID=A0ABM0K1H2_APLCA|nr:uncharacterized protein LOC101859963 [Aplysia californica]